MNRKLYALLIIIATSITALAQSRPVGVADYCTSAPGVTISLLTCSPGSDIYELEGHTGLRIRTPQDDFVANWGMFDFDAPGFVWRFVLGQTDYSLALMPTPLFLNSYARHGRGVTEQVLALDSAQCVRLWDMVMENARPENRVYRYNYIHDNCATRPLRLIELALASDSLTIGAPTQTRYATSFRQAMRYFHQAYPWYQFGIDLALGPEIDHILTPEEHAFAPVALEEMAAGSIIRTPYGTHRPLVSATYELVPPGHGGPLAPTPWYATPIAVFIILLTATCGVSIHDIRRHKVNRVFDAVFYTLIGLTGCLSAFLVFISVHAATSPDYLLLWVNPLCFIVPVCIIIRRGKCLLTVFQWLNLAGLAAFAVIWMSGIQSGNYAFIPLMAADALRAITYLFISKHESINTQRR
ncbi:MAG: DUF4105 domain-containing protein [Muribaculaceae bacterium]|nr:DUF4105 domain-containing protein [Muribaculaceae bacterium]